MHSQVELGLRSLLNCVLICSILAEHGGPIGWRDPPAFGENFGVFLERNASNGDRASGILHGPVGRAVGGHLSEPFLNRGQILL